MKKHIITNKKMIAELVRISKKLGKKDFTGDEFEKAGGKHFVVLVRKIGWAKAMRKAGLD